MANKSVGLLTIAFGANTAGFDKAMKKAQRSIKKFGASMQRTGKNLTRNLTVPLLAFAAASVKAFDEQIVAETKLLTALKGKEDIQKRLITQAKELQTKTLFGDEETIKAQTLLAALGLTEEQIKMLIPQIQNMATGLSMDLVGATSLVSKSVSTTTDALARYFNTGLKGVTGQQERAIILTQSLSEKFEGQAEAIRNKGLGAFKALGNAIGDVGEEFGEIISEQLIPLNEHLNKLTKTILSLTKEQKENIVFYGKILAVVGPVITILGILAASISAIIGFFASLSAGAIAAVLSGIGLAAIYVYEQFQKFTNSKKNIDGVTSSLKEMKSITDKIGNTMDKEFKFFENPKKNIEDNDTPNDPENDRINVTIKKMERLKVVLLETGRAWKTYYSDNKEQSTMAEEAQQNWTDAVVTFESIFSSAMTSAAYSQEGFFKSLIKNLKQAVKQMLIQLAVVTAIKFMLGGGKLSLKDALAGGLKDTFNLSNVPALSSGGIVTGPQLALIGEGNESEAVIPLSKLDSMLNNNNNGGVGQIEVFGRISGNDIFISNQKSTNSRFRSV